MAGRAARIADIYDEWEQKSRTPRADGSYSPATPFPVDTLATEGLDVPGFDFEELCAALVGVTRQLQFGFGDGMHLKLLAWIGDLIKLNFYDSDYAHLWVLIRSAFSAELVSPHVSEVVHAYAQTPPAVIDWMCAGGTALPYLAFPRWKVC